MGHKCQSQFADFYLLQNVLVTPSASVTSAVSVTPETDSAGNKLNTRSLNFADYELLDSLESDYTYEDDEDASPNQNFDFSSFQEVLEDIPISKQKRFKNGTRSSLTFSNQKMRDIERENQILLTKIMKRGPSRDIDVPKGPGSAVSLKSIRFFHFHWLLGLSSVSRINDRHSNPLLKSIAARNSNKLTTKIRFWNGNWTKLPRVASKSDSPKKSNLNFVQIYFGNHEFIVQSLFEIRFASEMNKKCEWKLEGGFQLASSANFHVV